ncbi:flagellar motor switch protein FliN [Porticoccus sp.]
MNEQVDSPEADAVTKSATGGKSVPVTEFKTDSAAARGNGSGGEINLDALMDVPVTLSVEIGRSKLPIKELISLTQGAVVELDRLVDEPLDLMVNGMLIARGEVVVVDGQFGLRLIDIVSPSERLKKLK